MPFRPSITVALLAVGSALGGTNQAIVVTAPRLDNLDLMAVDVAADVTVIDREAIEQSGSVSVPQLLESQGNVLVRGQGGNANDGQISLRGFGENSHVRVLVLVDGHKANRPDMGGIEWGNLPVSNIERIEIIRGGQNVLYGNQALSGVVKITTRRGEGDGLRMSGAIGSDGYISGGISYGGDAGDGFYQAGASGFDYGGFRTNSASSASTVYGSAGWYVGDTDTVVLRGALGTSRTEYPGALTHAEAQRDPTQSSTPGEYSEDESGQATLLYETERDWGAARINAGVNYRDRFSTLGRGNVENTQRGFSLAPRARIGSEDSFCMAGFDLFLDGLDVDNYLAAYPSTRWSWAELERATVAPYFFAQRTFGSKTVVNGGARYEYAGTDNQYVEYVGNQLLPTLETNRGTFPNPNYKNPPDVDAGKSYEGRIEKEGWAAELSVAQTLSGGWDVFAGYDRVYRYPTLDEAAAYQGYPLSDPLNENLDPERGNNFEAGTRFANRAWNLSLTGFYMALENEIAYVEYNDPVSGDLVNLNANIGETQRLGAEAELGWSPSWYGASARWTFVDARFDGGPYAGKTVPLVPWAHGVTSAWVEPVEDMRFTVSYTYVSGQYQGNDFNNEQQKMDAYGLVGLLYNVAVSDYADIYVSIDNLFDENYSSVAYSGGFHPSAGRSFRMGLSLVFWP